MTTLNLHSLDPSELMPTPEILGSNAPNDPEEEHVYPLVKDALDNPSGKLYSRAADFIEELRAEFIA
jgi:hypothetical protein